MTTTLTRPCGPLDLAPGRAPVPGGRDVDAEFARIVDELSRRGFLAGGMGAATLLGLAACGSSGGSAADPSTAATTRRVTTAAGTFTVPISPARIVCIDYFSAIFLLELGLTPVGGIDFSWVDASSMYPAYIPKLKQLADIGEITSTNFEKVTALQPDLILGPTPGSQYDNSKGALTKLRAVATVASIDFGQTGDWRSPLDQTAQLVNRTDQLKPLVADYRSAIDRTKAAYREVLASTVVTVVDNSQEGISPSTCRSPATAWCWPTSACASDRPVPGTAPTAVSSRSSGWATWPTPTSSSTGPTQPAPPPAASRTSSSCPAGRTCRP
jgi:iron complex transport system substrate-binding protein